MDDYYWSYNAITCGLEISPRQQYLEMPGRKLSMFGWEYSIHHFLSPVLSFSPVSLDSNIELNVYLKAFIDYGSVWIELIVAEIEN